MGTTARIIVQVLPQCCAPCGPFWFECASLMGAPFMKSVVFVEVCVDVDVAVEMIEDTVEVATARGVGWMGAPPRWSIGLIWSAGTSMMMVVSGSVDGEE